MLLDSQNSLVQLIFHHNNIKKQSSQDIIFASHLAPERDELLLLHDLLNSLHDLRVKRVVDLHSLAFDYLLDPALPCEFFVG